MLSIPVQLLCCVCVCARARARVCAGVYACMDIYTQRSHALSRARARARALSRALAFSHSPTHSLSLSLHPSLPPSISLSHTHANSHYELAGARLLQYPRGAHGAAGSGGAPRREVDVSACAVRAQRDTGGSGCFFKLSRGGLKLEFMCPSADECAAWVAALARAAASAGPGAVVDSQRRSSPPPRMPRYTDLEDAEGGAGVSVQQDASGFPVVCLVNPRGPAAQSGIEVGMLICAISGTSARGMPLSQVAELLLGPPGSCVDLVLADGSGAALALPRVRLTRAKLSALAEPPPAAPAPMRASEPPIAEKLRRDLGAFYKRVAPEKTGRVPVIVRDFVSRGATREELQHLNDELRQTYGADLSSVAASPHSAALDVNVGGRLFSLSGATVDKFPHSLLDTVRSAGRPVDGRGNLFIARDPALFEAIAEYMRSGAVRQYTTSAELQRAIQEASEYGVPGLALQLAQQLHQQVLLRNASLSHGPPARCRGWEERGSEAAMLTTPRLTTALCLHVLRSS